MTSAPTSDIDASRAYTLAFELHHTKRSLLDALARYRALITLYPSTLEATNARAQIAAITKSVVPDDELMDLEIELARSILLKAL